MASYELKDLGDDVIQITTTSQDGSRINVETADKTEKLAQLALDSASLQALLDDNTTLATLINSME